LRAQQRRFRSKPLIVTRRVFAPALSLAGLAALVAFAPLHLIDDAMAQSATAALVAKPVSLPDMALGPAKASVTIVEYASMSCPHCAAFEENVLPMLKSKYIDTGKVRFVFREFPLDIKAAAASMLARCIANDDAGKFFGAIATLFKQQDQLMEQTKDTLKLIGAQAGMSEQAVEACEKDQALLDKLSADQKFAFEILKVDATPTFFINGEMLKGAMSFEELEAKIKPLLKH
jgi:protein-disulfide isomerase